jgi:hypothetical protein
MTFRSLFSARKTVLLLVIAMPALACNPLSSVEEEADDIATAVIEGISNASEQAAEALQDNEAASSDSSESAAADDQPSQSDQADTSEPSDEEAGVSQDMIAEAMRASLGIESMRIRVIIEDLTNGVTTEVTMAFIDPDRYQLSSDGLELIVIGDTTYMGTPDGEWVETPSNMAGTIQESLASYVSEEAIEQRLNEDWSNFHSLGTEVINGVEAAGYEFEERVLAQYLGIVRIWIGVEDGLIYRQEIENEISGIDNRTTLEFEYGDSVTIEPPF